MSDDAIWTELEEAYSAGIAQGFTEGEKQQREIVKEAFITGYELGHNDTVESAYTDAEDRFHDWLIDEPCLPDAIRRGGKDD